MWPLNPMAGMPNMPGTSLPNMQVPNMPLPFGNMDWAKSWSEASVKAYTTMCQEAMNATKRRVQENSEYLKEISECKGPADMVACHSAFMQKAVSNCISDWQSAVDKINSGLTAAAKK
jgi:hypothetical protein